MRCPAGKLRSKSAERGRFRESALLRHLFEKTVARCIADGLVSGQRLAADARLIEGEEDQKLIRGINGPTNANKQNSTPKEDWDRSAINPNDAPRAVKEYLDALNDAAFGAASKVEPKFTSHSDPASQWAPARKGPFVIGGAILGHGSGGVVLSRAA